MNVKLLRKVIKYILKEPRRFNLEVWGGSANPNDFKTIGDYYLVGEILSSQRPPCGAVGCIAGNICILDGSIKPKLLGNSEIYDFPQRTPHLAAKALGIDKEAAMRLFYLKSWGNYSKDGESLGWPEKFEQRLNKAKPGGIKYAKIAAERIEHFIKTKGAE